MIYQLILTLQLVASSADGWHHGLVTFRTYDYLFDVVFDQGANNLYSARATAKTILATPPFWVLSSPIHSYADGVRYKANGGTYWKSREGQGIWFKLWLLKVF